MQKDMKREKKRVIDFCEALHIAAIHFPLQKEKTPGGGASEKTKAQKEFPSLFIPAARKGYHGLFVELIQESDAKISDRQKCWIDYLYRNGYCAIICYGADDAIKNIKFYFDE